MGSAVDIAPVARAVARPTARAVTTGRVAVVLVAAAVVAELLRVGGGVDRIELASSWQLLDLDVLEHDPLRGIWFLHTQPPLHNLVIGLVAWSPLPLAGTVFLLYAGPTPVGRRVATPVATAAPALPPSPSSSSTEPSTSAAPSAAAPPVTAPVVARDVLVLGDSLVWVVAGNPPPDSELAVRGVFHARCDIIGDRILAGGHVNEVDPDCRRWPERWDVALRDDPPDVVIVIGGLRQLFDLEVDGRRVAVGSADWEGTYRRAVRRALGIIRRRVAAPVLWFDVPCYRWDAEGTDGEERDPQRIEIVNAALRAELAADPGVTLVDYRSRVCDVDRSIESLRPDGAHLTVPATHELWRWLEPIVLRRLAEGAG